MNRRLIAILFISTIFLTGCNNVSTENKDSASNSGASPVESGLAFQEKAKQAAKTLEEDPLKDLDSSGTK